VIYLLMGLGAVLLLVAGFDFWRQNRRRRLRQLLEGAPPVSRASRPARVRKASGRQVQQVRAALPLWVELLAMALEAGLALPEAIKRVAGGMPGPLSDAMLQVLQEQAAGKAPAQAWQDLMRRYPLPDLRVVALVLAQATRYGNPVAEPLRYQVEQMRTREQARIQALVRSAAVRMKLPMVVLMLVPFLSLLLAPALAMITSLLGG
jgi:Flp pilus assembly protein TadB